MSAYVSCNKIIALCSLYKYTSKIIKYLWQNEAHEGKRGKVWHEICLVSSTIKFVVAEYKTVLSISI